MLVAPYHMLVNGVIIVGCGSWDGERFSMWEYSQPDQLLQLLDNKRLVEEGEGMTDKWIWRDLVSIVYVVKATYNHLKRVEQVGFGEFFAEFWKLKTLPSVQVTFWRMLTN